MEPKFQTSFIPKKPIANAGSAIIQKPKTGFASLYMTIAVVLFVASLGSIGGAFAYQQFLEAHLAASQKTLTQREQQFNIDLIQQLREINVKIDNSQKLLASHVATSRVFDIIPKFTSAHVRFLNMDLTTAASGKPAQISLQGYGTGLQAVAFQSDVFSSLEQYGLRNIVKNPIMSDPSIDQSTGKASFGFTATISSDALSYVGEFGKAGTSQAK